MTIDTSSARDTVAPTAAGAAATFTTKWRARWPEWRIGEVFVPATQRDVAVAWLALLQEFTDAAWTGEDATPGLAKLAWWNEELLGWAKGARRHPLSPVLQRQPVDWSALAANLRGLQATRGAAPTGDPAAAELDGFAAAVAAAETRLFNATPAPMGEGTAGSTGTVAAVRSVVLDLLAERALLHADADVAARLLVEFPRAGITAPRVRRLQSAYLRHRLWQVGGGAIVAPSPWRSLLLSWRAARGA